MNQPPHRTGKTFLSDDDLLIFDFLWRIGPCNFGAFRRVDYSFHMNCRHTHSLSDVDLVDHVQTLAQLRLLNYRRSIPRKGIRRQRLGADQPPFTFPFPKAIVSLNSDGFDLWGEERDPDWSGFLWHEPSPDGTITVASLSKASVLDYLMVCHETRRFELCSPVEDIEFQHRERQFIFEWRRPFSDVYAATVKRSDTLQNDLLRVWDIQAYEEQRTWWSRTEWSRIR